ncbi:hypothetical protein DsansV1_C07g0070321 [Dioscorea sansibarensis]
MTPALSPPLVDPFDGRELAQIGVFEVYVSRVVSAPNALVPAIYPTALPTQAPQCLN